MPENERRSGDDGTSPPDVYHVERDEAYLRELRAEEEFWDARSATLLSREGSAPELQRYQNERLTGDAEKKWFQVISDFGRFRRGCVLGAGPGRVEGHLLERQTDLRLTIYDISGESLGRLHEGLQQTYPGRAQIRQEDLNFVTLEENSYDLVIANACMHHILNLEHVAYQVNRSLTSDGYFFMKDTVGESYFQFTDEKKRLYQAFVDATHDDPGRAQPIRWPDRDHWDYSPFESVRSGEILEVFARYLREERVRTAGAMLQLGLFGGPGSRTSPGALHQRAIRRVLRMAFRAGLVPRKTLLARGPARGELLRLLDSHYSDSGRLKPGIAFAIYRKRAYS